MSVMLASDDELMKMARWAAVERDLHWDMAHEFVILKLHEGSLIPGTVVIFAGDIDPRDYPQMMISLALDELVRRYDDSEEAEELRRSDPPCAFMLVVEGYGVMMPTTDAPESEKKQFEHDRLERNFVNRPDRREVRMATIADLNGRIATVTKYRDTGDIEERILEPDSDEIGGRLTSALIRVAQAFGVAMRESGLWDGT